MVTAKKLNWQSLLVFVYLVLFPFGQLLRMQVLITDFKLVVHPIDVVVGLSAVWFLKRLPFWFTGSLLFSFILSLSIFKPWELIEGALYLLRLSVYLVYPVFYLSALKKKAVSQRLLYDALIVCIFFVALFGWWQYFIYPDLRPLQYLGWDDHLYRLAGSFLDPGFTAIILVLGFILAFSKYWQRKNLLYLFTAGFFSISLFFTYSRAGFVSLICALIYILLRWNKLRFLSLFAGLIIVFILLLPRPSSSGVELERLYSIFLRFRNYQETVAIWKKSPLFGIGYNNLCTARVKYVGEKEALSHSCSGSDSSLLLILSTTGIIGLVVFLQLVLKTLGHVENNVYGLAYSAGIIAVFSHSLFVNSLFYPWVMSLMGILYALGRKTISSNAE